MGQSASPMPTLIIGLSGPSSSGKSTLARLLRSIFNIVLPDRTLKLFILHEDDFYKPDNQIPIKTFTSAEHGERQLQDWDCADAMDFPPFERTLKHVKDYGCLPEDMYSKEDQNVLGESHVDGETIRRTAVDVEKWFAGLQLPDSMKHLQICLIDGFLLYSDPVTPSIPKSITDLLDLKLFLRVTLAQMIERRGMRAGYVTLGDFWVDPPGYVEDVVWSNYAREHSWMFEEGDANTGKEVARLRQEGVLVAPGNGEEKMVDLMAWGVQQVKQLVGRSACAPLISSAGGST